MKKPQALALESGQKMKSISEKSVVKPSDSAEENQNKREAAATTAHPSPHLSCAASQRCGCYHRAEAEAPPVPVAALASAWEWGWQPWGLAWVWQPSASALA